MKANRNNSNNTQKLNLHRNRRHLSESLTNVNCREARGAVNPRSTAVDKPNGYMSFNFVNTFYHWIFSKTKKPKNYI